MKLLACSWDARSASLTKSFMGHDIIKVGAKKFSLPEDIVKTHVSAEQNEMTALRMLLIIVLAITLIGLLFAIPLYFLSKKKRLTMAFKTKTGDTFTVLASNNREWKILRKYSGMEVFD